MCRAAYSPTQEKRELAMTKVTGITASYARCKLSEDSEGLRRPLVSEDKMARMRRDPRPPAWWRSSLPLLQMNAIGFSGLLSRGIT